MADAAVPSQQPTETHTPSDAPDGGYGNYMSDMTMAQQPSIEPQPTMPPGAASESEERADETEPNHDEADLPDHQYQHEHQHQHQHQGYHSLAQQADPSTPGVATPAGNGAAMQGLTSLGGPVLLPGHAQGLPPNSYHLAQNMTPMINYQGEGGYLPSPSHAMDAPAGEEMMQNAVTLFENLFPACVPAVMENSIPEEMISKARGWNKADLRTVLSSIPLRERLDLMLIPRSLFELAVKMRRDHSNGAPRTRFSVEISSEDSDASGRKRTRFRCLACHRHHGFHSGLQHVGSSLRCPRRNGQLDWTQWNPCPWAVFGLSFICTCLRPMPQSQKRKNDEDYEDEGEFQAKTPRPSTDYTRLSGPSGAGTPAGAAPPLALAGSQPGTVMARVPPLAFNAQFGSPAPARLGPGMGAMSLEGTSLDGWLMQLEKFKDDLESFYANVSQQHSVFIASINNMQSQLMQVKAAEEHAPSAAVASSQQS
ncbi:uncharacterized protein MONBRDRAFT_32907 [Monosiga brevicollis MX1]|uniref:Uncharacterized protein n=1 Tax=Monosiga brevicollis TaxID=81824 RepID=A9V2F7_MONBE|nr:uncharacterized protein MONBRDRAFT_32907 [Monosiga brevicollis MX1]EDQ88250.1 predicted protein [Monosiga brevicollis MX1]|eukprot:XP_001746843.1 hypothetical protein [Monosiga brevicollis MX1]